MKLLSVYIVFFSLIPFYAISQEIWTENADSVLARGIELQLDAADYEEAGEYFSKAQSLFLQQNDSVSWVDASLYYGETVVDRGFVREGLQLFLELDSIHVSRLPNAIAARIKNNVGWAYEVLEEPSTAKKYFLEGVSLLKGLNEAYLLQGHLNNNLAAIFNDLGESEIALKHSKQAIAAYKNLKNPYWLSVSLTNASYILNSVGMFERGEKYLRESVKIREELQNPDLLDVTYHNLAANFSRQGKRDSAIIYYQKSLKISRELNNPFDITQTLISIGALFHASGNYKNALLYYQEALSFNKQTGRFASISKNLSAIASVYLDSGNLAKAEEYFQQALEIMEGENERDALVSLYLELSSLELRRGNINKAVELIDSSLAIAKDINAYMLLARAHQMKGRALARNKRYRESLVQYKKAHQFYSSLPNFHIRPTIDLAQAFWQVNSDSAFHYAQEAFQKIDRKRTMLAAGLFKAGLFENHAYFYTEVANWYITKRNNFEKAFELVEAAKSRVLIEQLAAAQKEIFSSLDEATVIKKQKKTGHIDRLYNRLAVEKNAQKIKKLENELKEAEFDYQAFLNIVSLQNSKHVNFEYPKPVSAAQARDMLDSETALVEYAFSGQKLITFFVTQDAISATITDSIAGKPAKSFLSDNIRAFRTAITEKQPVDSLETFSGDLHDVLLKDYLDKHPEISQLLLVTAGAISFLPFEALTANSDYLIEHYTIKYLPSTSIYSFIKEPHRTTGSDLLALAGSGFGNQNGVTALTRSQGYASLPSTMLEVSSIAEKFPNTKVLKNKEVTEVFLKDHNLKEYRFIHFATHGNVDEVNPTQSGLILSNGEQMESLLAEDGYLNSTEISAFDLNADMVVLSACNTGMGKIITGEGLLGLQRSFLVAGASSVVVSLWSVYDRSTSVFMDDFYKHILRYQEEDYGVLNRSLDWFGFYEHPLFDYKTKALRAAKIAMIEHPYYNHPVHWAPFILIGK